MSDDRKTKQPRNIELRDKIANSGRVLDHKIAEAQAAAKAARYDALVDSTRACGVNDKKRKGVLSGLVEVRNAHVRGVENEYKLALQRAQGERQKGLNLAKAAFEKARDEVEAEMVAANAPHRATYAKDVVEIDADLENTIKGLNESHAKFVMPLQAELDALQEAARKKAAAEATAVPGGGA